MDSKSPIGYARLLCEQPFRDMYSDFSYWRIDEFIRQLELTRHPGRILPFVRGLRLAAHLIYAIRDILSDTDLEANWGHLLDQKGAHCSPECDVIIHHKGYRRRWNGTEKPIMDFRFIDQQKALAIISCKSYLRSSKVDKEYCVSMKPYIDKIWLFAECCGPRSAKSIQKKALDAGYENFWYLYTWSKQTAPKENPEGWNEFVEEVRKLSCVV